MDGAAGGGNAAPGRYRDIAQNAGRRGPYRNDGILYHCVFLFHGIIFVFPLIAKFENTTGSMIKNAILIPASRLPYAVMVLVMTGACVLLTFLDHRTIIAGIGIWSVIGAALLSYVNCFLIMKIFEPYL